MDAAVAAGRPPESTAFADDDWDRAQNDWLERWQAGERLPERSEPGGKRRKKWQSLTQAHGRHFDAAQARGDPQPDAPEAAEQAAPAAAAVAPAAAAAVPTAAATSASTSASREELRALRRDCLDAGVEYSISDTIDELRTKLTEKLTDELAAQPSPAPPPAPVPARTPSPTHVLPAALAPVMDVRGDLPAFPQTKPEGKAYGWWCCSCSKPASAQAWFPGDEPHIAACPFCSRWLCESCAEAEPLISDAFVRPCSDCRRGRAIERVLPLPGRCWPVQPQPPGVVNSEWRGPRPPNLLPGLEWPPPSGLVYHFDAPTACGKYAMSVKAVHAPATPQWNDDCDEDYAAVLSGLV
jgi:hypothetical protein